MHFFLKVAVEVKWSVCIPSTLTIQVGIPAEDYNLGFVNIA